MKRIISFSIAALIGVFLTVNQAEAQSELTKGNFLLNGGIGLGYSYAGGVPVIVSGEYAFSDKFSFGGYFAYTTWNYGYFSYRYRYTFIDFGVRGSYHFNELFKINNDQLDIYGGGSLGFLVSSFSGNTGSGYDDLYGGGLRPGVHAGARYYFSDKFAGYGELGYGLAYLSVGVTLKL